VELSAPAVAGTTTLELPTDSIKPGMVLVAASSFTTASTVAVDNCFTSTYENYRVMVRISAASADGIIDLRMRASGTENSSSNYRYGGVQIRQTDGNVASVASGATTTQFYLGTADSAASVNFSVCDILAPALTDYTRYTFTDSAMTDGTSFFFHVGGGVMSVTTAYDGFVVRPASGTITGSLYVYGYRKEV
jgi:hypothetical protein